MLSHNQKIYTSLVRPIKYNGFVKEVLFSANGSELYLYKKSCYKRNKVKETAKLMRINDARKYISNISSLNPFYYMALSDIGKGIDALKNDFPLLNKKDQTSDKLTENSVTSDNLEDYHSPHI